MTTNQPHHSDALEHVDPKRRGFLAKMLAGSVALPVMSTVAFAEPQQDGKGKGKGGKGKGGQGGQGKGGQGKGKGQGGQMGDRDPAALAKRMIQEFDKDGDRKLSLAELTMALKAMQERRSGGGQRGRRDQGGGAGAGKGKGGGAGKGKGKGNSGDTAIGGAGVKPKPPGQ